MLLLIGTTTMAQEKVRSHRGGMHDMTSEQIATLQTKKMTLELDLSEAQQNQIQALNLENAEAKKAKMAARKAMRESGDREKPTSDEHYDALNKRLDAQLAHKEEMKKILSDTQMEKWAKMRHGKMKHGRKAHRSKGKKGRR